MFASVDELLVEFCQPLYDCDVCQKLGVVLVVAETIFSMHLPIAHSEIA